MSGPTYQDKAKLLDLANKAQLCNMLLDWIDQAEAEAFARGRVSGRKAAASDMRASLQLMREG